MPYEFEFFIHHELVFHHSLEGEQCTYRRPDGHRCRRQTVIGYGLCWQHLLKEKHLRIRTSTIPGAGKGLFCLDPTRRSGEVIYRTNEKILQYGGEVLTRHELDERYPGDVTAPYTVQNHRQMFEDAALERSPAAIINHKPRRQCNCELITQRNNLCAIRTTRPIQNGDELFCNYGNEYHIDEPDVMYRTVYRARRPRRR